MLKIVLFDNPASIGGVVEY